MKYVVYLTEYTGDKLPKYYIGSTSKNKILSGRYFGSVSSKKWKDIFREEVKNNYHLFSVNILSEHETREIALREELRIQIERNVVQSVNYINESFASINGFFGRDVKGKNHPMFNKKHSEETKDKIRLFQKGKSFEDKVGKDKAKEWKEKIKTNTFTSKSEIEKLEIKNKISLSLKNTFSEGRIFTEEWKNNISKSKKGIKPWNYGKNKIIQKDLEGKIIREWDSIQDIKNELNLPQGNICKCCQGKRNKVGGYKWEYKFI